MNVQQQQQQQKQHLRRRQYYTFRGVLTISRNLIIDFLRSYNECSTTTRTGATTTETTTTTTTETTAEDGNPTNLKAF